MQNRGETDMENKNQKKKGGTGIGFIIGILLVLSAFYEGFDEDILPFIVVIAVGVAVIAFIKKAAGAARDRAAQQKGGASVAQHMKRHEPKVEIHRDFPEPEAHCVVCENTGVDHFDRDRQMRLQQLDDWLKNGLIDREEYAVLKRKFEQN